MDISEQLFERAKRVLPGGVNSPVRAYRAVGMAPRFITRADGAYIYDEDGKRYIDYICSWGPMILGHNHPVIREAVERAVKDGLSFGAPTRREVEIAELMIGMVPNIEMVRMVNSGTEAVMSALRLARGATGRDKLIKFEGCYHGHSDCMLVNAGSSALAGGHPSSAGVPVGAARDTLTAQFNDLASVEAVAANMGVVGPAPGFLEGLRALCDKHGALLIFDEVITGFRLAPGGAQEYFGVRADLVTFGKIIGGGMPVGAYCGSRALLEQVAPCGPVYQAGTLSGNPVAMAAGLAQLTYLREHPEVYEHINARGAALAEGLRELVKRTGAPVVINQLGSLLAPFFTPTAVTTFTDAKGSDVAKYARYFQGPFCVQPSILSTRRWWRPPSNGVLRKASTMQSAILFPISPPPMASMLASLCRRVISAERGSLHRAQRMPFTLLAAMEMPMPVVQITIPRSHAPEATASAAARPKSG